MADASTALPSEPVHRTRNDYCTPESVLRVVRRVGPLGLDPCSNPWSTVRARVELSKHRGECGLGAQWDELVRPGEVVFMNPPYSPGNIPRWIDTMLTWAPTAHSFGWHIVALVPADPSTEAFQRAWHEANGFCFWGRRIAFDGAPKNGNPWSSVLWYFGPKPHRFCHYLGKHGIVQVLRGAP